MTKARLSLRGIHKNMGGKNILSNISFSIDTKEIIGLLGPNGAGTVSYTHLTLPTTPYV